MHNALHALYALYARHTCIDSSISYYRYLMYRGFTLSFQVPRRRANRTTLACNAHCCLVGQLYIEYDVYSIYNGSNFVTIFVCTAIPKAAEEAGRQEAEKKEEADKAKQVWYCWVVNIIIGYCWTCFVFIDITINNEFFALEPVFAHELMSSLVGATFHAWSTLSEQRKLIVLRT